MSSSARGLAALALALLGAACADIERGRPLEELDAGTGGGDGGNGGAVSFAETVHPILLSGCQGCHRTGGAAGGTSFLLSGDAAADLAAATDLIDTSDAAGSRLVRKASGSAHGGGAVYAEGSPEYQSLVDWIAGGAAP